MPCVFVYEHVTAVGLGRAPGSPEHSLYVEGRAMRSAVSADFAAVPGVELVTFPDDVRAELHADTFARLAASADWTLVIAPETNCVMEELVARVFAAGGKLLGPITIAVALAGDKAAVDVLWKSDGVPTPKSFSTLQEVTFPAVVKPRDGCGSEGVMLIRSADELYAVPADPKLMAHEFVPGQPASVAFLVGPKQTIPLLPTYQHLSSDGRFRYRGGSLPIPQELAERAVGLGRRAIASVPGLFGYVGVDLVLGERDVAIEINPRLTTSYVGLRAAAETNLAGAMLDVCEGREVELQWKPGTITFGADGTLR